jgi:hypothetical protein
MNREPQFPKGPAWVQQMNALLISRYAVPIVFGRRPHPRQAAAINAATASVVEVEDITFLLTAAHVMKAALESLRSPRSHFVLGNVELRVDENAVHLDRRCDIATAPVTRRERDALEADGFHIIRPTAWPPPTPSTGAAIVTAGYPGPWRVHSAWDELELRSFAMLALVHEIHDSEFVCQLDPAYVVETRAESSEELPVVDLPGLSGSPAFIVSNDPTEIVSPRLCGVVTKGLNLGDGNLIVKYARLELLGLPGGLLPT